MIREDKGNFCMNVVRGVGSKKTGLSPFRPGFRCETLPSCRTTSTLLTSGTEAEEGLAGGSTSRGTHCMQARQVWVLSEVGNNTRRETYIHLYFGKAQGLVEFRSLECA
jgi:hypothetical protein